MRVCECALNIMRRLTFTRRSRIHSSTYSAIKRIAQQNNSHVESCTPCALSRYSCLARRTHTAHDYHEHRTFSFDFIYLSNRQKRDSQCRCAVRSRSHRSPARLAASRSRLYFDYCCYCSDSCARMESGAHTFLIVRCCFKSNEPNDLRQTNGPK